MLPSHMDRSLQAWPALSHLVYVPHTEEEYARLVEVLDNLIDEVGEDEAHPLASLMEIVGVLIERYEEEHVPELSRE
jgi:HTH-type transcriptional regulator/antitoxin HigA